jgi:hypothetical protein
VLYAAPTVCGAYGKQRAACSAYRMRRLWQAAFAARSAYRMQHLVHAAPTTCGACCKQHLLHAAPTAAFPACSASCKLIIQSMKQAAYYTIHKRQRRPMIGRRLHL